jgi:putative phage-type endonuclease
MRIINVEQRTTEWFAARLGVPSASNFERVITPGGKRSTQVEAYMNRLVADILTGVSEQHQPSEAMMRGTELEPEARAYYELIAGPVEEIGFCIHDDGFGCSPDGVVGDGLLEIKCPLAHTHVEYLRAGHLPSTYIPQVQGQMLVMDKQWCDFLSYHPSMKPLLVRVNRDDKYCAMLHEALKELVRDVKANVELFRR